MKKSPTSKDANGAKVTSTDDKTELLITYPYNLT